MSSVLTARANVIQVRNFAVRELAIVAELERHFFFVVRGGEDHVSWAYPVTVDETPHRVTLGTGESIFGA
jgi:hypothetical protein